MPYPTDTSNIDGLNNARIGTGDLGRIAIDSNAQAIAIQSLVAKVGITGDTRVTTLDKRVATLEVGVGGGIITGFTLFDANGVGWNLRISLTGALNTVSSGTTGYPSTYQATY